MPHPSFRPTLLALCLWLIAGTGVAGGEELPPLPALTEPASETRLPGKFVWADLFASDIDAARQFYTETFGWEWRWITREAEQPYGMLYNDGRAVAGVARRAAPDADKPYGRWIHYVSVRDVARAAATAKARGGRVLLEPRSIRARGDFAIVTDADGAPFGVLHSSSGDPPDYRAAVGDWLWEVVFSHDAAATAQRYAAAFGYDLHESELHGAGLEYILASEGHARAGVGQLGEGADAKPTWLGIVRVADVSDTLELARAAGGAVLYQSQPEDPDAGISVLADPFGATVGVMQWEFDDSTPDAAEATP